MTDAGDPRPNLTSPSVYQIRIRSHLGSEWSDWFEGLSVTLEESGDTLLSGPIADQAALYGLLRKVRDLGMTLISVRPIDLRRQEASAPDAPREAPGKE